MEDLPQPVQQALQQLEKVAFDTLEEDRIIFTLKDLPEIYKDDPSCYGLLQSVQCYCSDEIGTTTNSLNFYTWEFKNTLLLNMYQPYGVSITDGIILC